MKRNVVTFGIVAAIVMGIVGFNMAFEKEPITAAQQKASEQAAETIQLAEAAGAEEAAKAAASEQEEAEKPKKDVPRFDDVETTEEWPEEAPDVFKLLVRCSNGDVLMEVHKAWAPIGAAHFYELCKNDFYDEARFFRVIPGFMAQIGLAADPAMTAKWGKNIKDEPVLQSNTPGMVSFAQTNRPNTRSTQIFINTGDNRRLDGMNFSPFAKVIRGLETVEKINPEYREAPDQGQITRNGNEYLKAKFPRLDYIEDVLLVK